MTASLEPYDVHIKLRDLSQLFNALDPSPLLERDLDDSVEEYILDWAEDSPPGAPLRLVVHARAPTTGEHGTEDLTEALSNNFAYRAERERRRIRTLLRQGRQAIIAGALFLAVCSLLAQGASTTFGDPVGPLVGEGLLILGWVANWRPVEIFLYDWRPARQRAERYEALQRMRVELRVS